MLLSTFLILNVNYVLDTQAGHTVNYLLHFFKQENSSELTFVFPAWIVILITLRGVQMESQSFDLTLEQQFEMRRIQDASIEISREDALDMLIQVSRLLMVKKNVISELVQEMPLNPSS